MVLYGIHLYPIKSCAGIELPAAEIEPRGLRGDRRYMVIDEDGVFQTQREAPAMALIRPRPRVAPGEDPIAAAQAGCPAGLVLSAPGQPDLAVQPNGGPRRPVRIWKDEVLCEDLGDEPAAWLSAYLGRPCRLVHQPDESLRPVDPHYAAPQDQVSLADGFPVLVVSLETLDDLNARLPEGEPPMTMARFRPNLVLAGGAPGIEDQGARLQVGAVDLALVKPCARCPIPTVDPETGRFAGKEPLRTLSTYRRRGNNVLFGQNAIPRRAGWIALGDPAAVLSAGTSPALQ